jgi:signal transduction histidine kinase
MLASLRRARDRRASLQRRMVPVGVLILLVILIASVRAKPGIGLHGASLVLLLGLCAFTAGVLGIRSTLLARRASPRMYGPVLALLVVGSAVLVWVQPVGPGLGGLLFVAVVVVVARLVPPWAGIALVFISVLFNLGVLTGILGLHPHPRWSDLGATIIPFIAPIVAMVLLVLFVWRIREAEQESERLLAQIEETRSAELRAAALAERQRLARDMHDVLAHSLSGLLLQLEGARLLVKSDPGDERLVQTIERAHTLAKTGLDEARRAIGVLRDEDLPGPESLAVLAAGFEADTSVPCQFTTAGTARQLSSGVKLTLYRATQEALTNVRRYARPEHVEVRLEYQHEEVGLAVEDFGAGPGPDGLAAGPVGSGYGLTGMRERAELLGGTLEAGPTGHGFLVRLRVPA